MKLIKLIILSVFMVSLIVISCKTTGTDDQENPEPVLRPEDVFPQEIITQIRTPYNIANNEVEITYIGSHGYLFSTSSTKIIIDSLSEIGGGYERTSGVILNMLNRTEVPFNNIQLALSTHDHGDHFNVDSIIDFLIANPQSIHLTTVEAEATLQSSNRYNQITSQSMAITPELGARLQTEINGIVVDVIGVDHHGDSGYEHVAFMFTLNGIKILHVGDSCKLPVQYETLCLEGENIDILIAPFGSSCSNWTLVFEEEGQNPFTIISRYIRPKHIIVSHQNFETTSPEIQETVNTLAENLPGITFSVFHPTILKQKIYSKEENNIQVMDKPTS